MRKFQNSKAKMSKKCLPNHRQRSKVRLMKSRKENPKNKNLAAQGRSISTLGYGSLEQMQP